MAQKATDASASSNAETLAGILDPVEIFSVPFLGPKAAQFRAVRRDAKKIKKTLARILNFASVSSRSLERCAERGPKTKRLVRLNN